MRLFNDDVLATYVVSTALAEERVTLLESQVFSKMYDAELQAE